MKTYTKTDVADLVANFLEEIADHDDHESIVPYYRDETGIENIDDVAMAFVSAARLGIATGGNLDEALGSLCVAAIIVGFRIGKEQGEIAYLEKAVE